MKLQNIFQTLLYLWYPRSVKWTNRVLTTNLRFSLTFERSTILSEVCWALRQQAYTSHIQSCTQGINIVEMAHSLLSMESHIQYTGSKKSVYLNVRNKVIYFMYFWDIVCEASYAGLISVCPNYRSTRSNIKAPKFLTLTYAIIYTCCLCELRICFEHKKLVGLQVLVLHLTFCCVIHQRAGMFVV